LYSIGRLSFLVFGLSGPLQHLTVPWLAPLGLGTVLAASLGALAAPSVRRLVAWLTIGSVGLIFAALATPTAASLTAALYYLCHSTLAVATFFLLADQIALRRGPGEDTLPLGGEDATWQHSPGALKALFLLLAILVSGLPPLSGFFGKAFVLAAALDGPHPGATLAVALTGSLFALIALSRAGTGLFWRRAESPAAQAHPPLGLGQCVALALLLVSSACLVAAGGPLRAWLGTAAAQTLDAAGYVQQVMAPHPAAKE
jgi:multicomponent K+:H+ antiporter subunit D